MSAILSADDLNDFISPGVACIKPVETLPKQDDSNPYEVTTEDKVQAQNPAPASISLTDCLACLGCVTSAEAVLVSLQSHTEVLNTLDGYHSLNPQELLGEENGMINGNKHMAQEGKLFIASVSPQVRASLAATFGISEVQAGHMIEQFLAGPQGLRSSGTQKSDFAYVVDTNQMRDACLVLGADEVVESIRDNSKPRPILTSACPGWICYAEKTHPHVLPHLSQLKSPQALTGTLLKSVLSKQLSVHPSQIWHLAIMPCFDKKLEASREELTDRWWDASPSIESSHPPVRDVDCVITSRELLSLASARDIQLAALPLSPLPRASFPEPRISQFLFPPPRRRQRQTVDAGTSGGYLHHILLSTQSQHPGSTISITRGRNADVAEYSLLSPQGAVLFKAARYYGFRNIQNLVRKLKPVRQSKLPGAARRMTEKGGGIEYAYVEVMACPGGCTNGGGQMKVEDVESILPLTRGEKVAVEMVQGQSQKEWLRRVDEAYYSADSEEDEDEDVKMTDNEEEEINGVSTRKVHALLDHWAEVVDVPLSTLAYTTFRKVVSDVGKKSGKNIGDAERIASIAGMSGGGW